MITNDVVGNWLRMITLVLVSTGKHEYLSLCCTWYTFMKDICLVLVCRVMQWYRPFAVMWVCTMNGARVESITVIQ